jgi:hemerythrin-like domain-containing protein
MSEEPKPIAASLLMFHKIITRGLKVAGENVAAFSQPGRADETRREGLLSYVRSLAIIIHAHHMTEDEVAFPYYRDKLAGAPFDRLMSDHRDIDVALARINAALAGAEGGAAPDWSELEAALGAVKALWHPHIKLEQSHFIGKADELLPVEERFRLVGAMTEYGQGHTQPPFLTMPFMLYNLPAADRAKLTQALPAEMMQNLIPIVWKEKWAPMAPFFLK